MRKGNANRQKGRFAESVTIANGRSKRRIQNQALAKVSTPPKVVDPKSTSDYPKANTSTTTITTIAKGDLQKEKVVNVQQQNE